MIYLKPEGAVEMINTCVKQATDGLIDSIISTADIDADTDLMLANAVYFKGVWLDPFDSGCTSPGTFHCLDGSLVEAQFMSSCYPGHYVSCMDGFKVLRLPYRPNLGDYEWIKLTELREMFARIGRAVNYSGCAGQTPLYLDPVLQDRLTYGRKVIKSNSSVVDLV